MKKFLSSFAGFWTLSGILFFCWYLILTQSQTFLYLFVPVSAVLFVNTGILIRDGKLDIWEKHKVNFFVLTAVCLMAAFMSLLVFEFQNFIFDNLMAIFVFGVGLLWFTKFVDTVMKLKRFKGSIWVKFFNEYSVNKPIGALIAGMLATTICGFFLMEAMNIIGWFIFVVIMITLMAKLAKRLLDLSQESNDRFQVMLEEKLKAEHLKTELITNVSHDIKTPLTSIINYTDLINDETITHDQLMEYTDVISSKSLRLKALIEDLIEASKAGTGNITLEKKKLDWCEIIGQIAGEYDEQMTAHDLELVLKIPEPPMNVLADGRHLWRVLENLFSNACKYAMEGSRVYAELKKNEGEYIFSLKNVSREKLDISPDELTEQFVRGDRSRHTEGSGLGLYIARNLTEAMGGKLNIFISGDFYEIRLSFAAIEEAE